MGRTHSTAQDAYVKLRLHAANLGTSLLTAANILTRQGPAGGTCTDSA